MISSIKMQNFMRHRDKTVVFSDGLNVLRGKNEAGKSTILNAIAYALFGSRALDDSIGDTVTWGEPESSLKVELELDSGVVIVRSKSGAEVRSAGDVVVTGQTEVTAFCENLFGCDAATAPLLMFANQDAMRGILTQPPGAAGALMETLTGMDVFEKAILAIQEKLPLGSTAAKQAFIDKAESELELAKDDIEPVDEAHHLAEINALKVRMQQKAAKLAALSVDCANLLDQKTRLVSESATRKALIAQAAKVERDLETAQHAYAELKVDDAVEMDVSEIETLRNNIRLDKRKLDAQAALDKVLDELQSEPVLESSVESVEAEVIELQIKVHNASEALSALSAERQVSEALIIKESACGFCGLDISAMPAVLEKNIALSEKISANIELCSLHEAELAIFKDRLALCKKALRAQNVLANRLAKHEEFLKLDESVTPNKVELSFDRVDPESVKLSEATVDGMQRDRIEFEKARDKRVRLESLIAQAKTALVDINLQLSNTKDVDEDILKLNAELDNLEVLKSQVVDAHSAAQGEVHRATSELDRLKAAQAAIAVKVNTLEQSIRAARSEVEELDENNLLLRTVRAARPVVSAKLWNMLLGATSTMFSTIRGEPSVVTRSEKGFLVNGKSIKSGLSGSAKDALALALRVALIKAFIPDCRMLVVDEPAHACDADRTASMLGFLAASEFTQLLMVTHEETSEVFADTVIRLS